MTAETPQKPPDRREVKSRRKSGVVNFFNTIADVGLNVVGMRLDRITPADKASENIEAACFDLMSTLGEASGTAMARRVVDMYEALTDEEKFTFFQFLRTQFHVDYDAIKSASEKLFKTHDDEDLAQFLKVAEPRRQELFRRLNMAPHGTQSLVDMRSSLLYFLHEHPELHPVDADIQHLFASWFNRGFLDLSSIDWDTPAAVLEKLIEYETVHEMRGWDDLRRRLASDRRCFAFFHTALPDDPLVFVEVALVTGIAKYIGPIIATNREETRVSDADTAIFYSINNCLDGLRGISFGNFLIKQVVVELARELPQLKTFATLSPIPGFRSWLNKNVLDSPDSSIVSPEERETLAFLDQRGWQDDPDICKVLKPLMTELLATYLVKAKIGKNPKDPVARFHLGNGARLDSLNWLGDLSEERMQQSYGFLVNYVYDLTAIEANHEHYVEDHRVVTSDAVKNLAARTLMSEE